MTSFSSAIIDNVNFRRTAVQAGGIALVVFAAFAIMYVATNIAMTRSWWLLFGAVGIMFIMTLSARYAPFGLVTILVAFTANQTLVDITAGRWLLLGAVLAPFVFNVATRYRGGIVLTRFHLAFLFFLFLIFVSALYSENVLLSFAKGTSVFLMFGCFFLVLYYHLKFHPTDFDVIFRGLLYLNAVVILWVFVNQPADVLRFSLGFSVMGNPNSVGAFLALTTAYVVFQFYHAASRGARFFWLALLGLNLIVLFASGSRAGILGTLASLAVYWLARSRRGFYYFGGWMALVLATAMSLSPSVRSSVVDRYIYKYRSDSVFTSREGLWERSWDVFKRKPLTGVGFGVSEGMGESWEFQFASKNALLETGSSLMFLLEGMGLFGGIFGMLPLFMLIRHALPRYLRVVRARAPTEEDERFCVLFAAVIGGFLNCQFEGWLFAPGNMLTVVFWYMAALLLYMLTTMEEREMGLLPVPEDQPLPSAMRIAPDAV